MKCDSCEKDIFPSLKEYEGENFCDWCHTEVLKKIQKAKRTLSTAAANEVADINAIINAINTRSAVGCQIIAAFKARFGLEITAARNRTGSNRGTHYDFEIEVNGEWKKVEHKGSRTYRVPNANDVPWKAGVQFHNGGCEKYSICRKYADTWYDMYIQSESLREEFNLTATAPSREEWFAKDCRVQADPNTAFGKELKSKVRSLRGPKASLLEKRAAVLTALDITDEDISLLMTEVLPIANHALEQKEYWISIHGNIEKDFHVAWYPQFRIDTISKVVLKKSRDLEITFTCADDFVFHGILRWGKGAGFSCLRMDLK